MAEAARRMTANDDDPDLTGGIETRLRVLLSATVQSGQNIIAVRLREVSRFSALVEGATIPPVGSLVRFCRGGVEVAARVSCAARGSFELQFREAVEERKLLIAIGRSASGNGAASHKAIFPMSDYVGSPDDEDRLPISKH